MNKGGVAAVFAAAPFGCIVPVLILLANVVQNRLVNVLLLAKNARK